MKQEHHDHGLALQGHGKKKSCVTSLITNLCSCYHGLGRFVPMALTAGTGGRGPSQQTHTSLTDRHNDIVESRLNQSRDIFSQNLQQNMVGMIDKNKAKAISAELLEFNLKNKLEETGKK